MNFEQFLRMSVRRKLFGESPEGDFAADALRDSRFCGRNFKTWEALETFLDFHRACPEAVAAAKVLFKKWKAAE